MITCVNWGSVSNHSVYTSLEENVWRASWDSYHEQVSLSGYSKMSYPQDEAPITENFL